MRDRLADDTSDEFQEAINRSAQFEKRRASSLSPLPAGERGEKRARALVWFRSINCAIFAGSSVPSPADSTVFSLHTDPASSNLNNTSAEVRPFLFRRTVQSPLDRNEWLDAVSIGSKRSLSEE